MEHLEVSVTALDGDKDAAKRVAERVKEHVGSTGGERADFITFVDQCIAEMVETQSLSEVVSAAGGGSKATVQNQEDAACQLRSQPSDDSHPAVDHHRGSNSPEGTADHDRFGDGGLPTRPPTRDGRCGEKKKRDDEKKCFCNCNDPISKPSSRSVSGGKGGLLLKGGRTEALRPGSIVI